MNSPRRVAVIGGIRIPFARQNGPYAHASNQDMLTATLDALVDKFGLEGQALGEVAAGAVLKHSRDFNLTRECVLGSKLSAQTPACRVEWASQLIPPNVDEVRKALRAEKPAALGRAVPLSRSASTFGEKEEPWTVTRP